MSSFPAHLRTGLRLIAILGAGALVLASCAPTRAASQRLSGTPALSISVPLSSVGCTLNDVCLAVGTSSASVGPTSVSEFSTPRGRWLSLALPTSPSPLITSIACSTSSCLVGGSQPGRDLLWRFDVTAHAMSIATPPSGGLGIDALNCNELNCALVDTSAQVGVPRFSFSADDGLTWTNPLSMNWAKNDAITALACGAVFDCIVGALSPRHQFVLYVTRDGGATWNQRSPSSAWTTVTSLSCAQLRCVALASTARSSVLIRSNTFARTWTSLSLGQHANALACSSPASCVVVGQRSNEAPWLATVHDGAAVNASLRYVPTPLLSVACGTKRCAAIGVTTVLSVPLTAPRST
jgi:hypothetical protein